MYAEAMSCTDHEQWKGAMEHEIASLDLHKTWKLVSRPQLHNAIGCKWIYKVNEVQLKNETLGTRF